MKNVSERILEKLLDVLLKEEVIRIDFSRNNANLERRLYYIIRDEITNEFEQFLLHLIRIED